ncbi:MAG: PQQ-binding-like beta-propeller repeat protein [Phycisphaerales bacterium]|nr:MAG: PQQ-binding-like beta-propeller repeat protein [Phycisphaerales bacterium]
MKKADLRLILTVCCSVALMLSHAQEAVGAESSDDVVTEAHRAIVAGKPLDFWVKRASTKLSKQECDQTVAALISGVVSDDDAVRVAAADTLALLGPRAKSAAKIVIAQLGDEQPWVRAACSGALVAMGKEAVPALINAFENETGGIRIRSAFALGAIGPAAKDAVPVLEAALEEENEVIRVRFIGILSNIVPEKYPAPAVVPQARFDPAEASQVDVPAASRNWPGFHGAARDAICRERGLLKEWPEDGPKMLWKLDGLGNGLSTVSIASGRLFTMGDRPCEDGEEMQFVLAYNLRTQKLLWATPIGPPHARNQKGPRCTPTVSGRLVYALGTEGDLACLSTGNGKILWKKNLVEEFGGKMMNVWKYSESPLVDGNKVICTPGGDDAMMVALNKSNGRTIWKCAVPKLGDKGSDGAGFSSAVVAEIDGVRQYVQLVGRGVIGVDARTGRFLWGYNRVANNVANIPTPVVRGPYVFTTTAYSTGAALLKIVRNVEGFEAREVYFIDPKDFQNHHGGVVLVGDHIYAGHGRNKGDAACVELATGKVVWKQKCPSKGSAAVLYADGSLIFRYDRGEVLLVEATPDEFRIKGRFKALCGDGPAWAHPVIHNGRLYLRHSDILACYDVRAL